MPIGYDYYCAACDREWLLFSTWHTLGPAQWDPVCYTCFTCQTFLTVAKFVDRNSWSIWRRNNQIDLDESPALSRLAQIVDQQLSEVSRLTPIELNFDSINCLNCDRDQMRDIPFGDHAMRCPHCLEYTGKFIDDRGIATYIFLPNESDES